MNKQPLGSQLSVGRRQTEKAPQLPHGPFLMKKKKVEPRVFWKHGLDGSIPGEQPWTLTKKPPLLLVWGQLITCWAVIQNCHRTVTSECLPTSFYLSFFFVFSGLHLLHMKVPRSVYTTATATPDPSRICNLHHSSRQHRILNTLRKTRDWTCILMDTSQVFNPLSHSGNSSNLLS